MADKSTAPGPRPRAPAWKMSVVLLAVACGQEIPDRSVDAADPSPLGAVPASSAEPIGAPPPDPARPPAAVVPPSSPGFEAGSPERSTLTLEEIGILASYGLREMEGGAAVFQKPLDAAFVGDRVVVLDASAPWVRVFERDGRFVGAFSRSGGGPGEATRPFSIAARGAGLLLSHATGIEEFDSAGTSVASIRRGQRVGGAVEACGSGVVALVHAVDSIPARALVRLASDGGVLDTIASFRPVRRSSGNYHPWFVAPRPDGLLVYTEEEGRSRLVDFGCSGEVLREIAIPVVGPGENLEVSGTRVTVRSPLPPHPAGLARLNDRVVWAMRLPASPDGSGPDPVTVFTAIDSSGRARDITVEGWYQLFDSDENGLLLISNTWTLGQNWAYPGTWGVFPAVYLVDGNALLRIIDERSPG